MIPFWYPIMVSPIEYLRETGNILLLATHSELPAIRFITYWNHTKYICFKCTDISERRLFPPLQTDWHKVWWILMQAFVIMEKRRMNMYCVVEYGGDIGMLKNFFQELDQALTFVQKIFKYSGSRYRCIGKNKWHCKARNEFLKIEEAWHGDPRFALFILSKCL